LAPSIGTVWPVIQRVSSEAERDHGRDILWVGEAGDRVGGLHPPAHLGWVGGAVNEPADQRRQNDAWRDLVDPDALCAVLERGGPRQADAAGLRERVGRDVLPPSRPDVEDVLTIAPPPVWSIESISHLRTWKTPAP
jgi:hypothetical protein